jgi:hypothetical protein
VGWEGGGRIEGGVNEGVELAKRPDADEAMPKRSIREREARLLVEAMACTRPSLSLNLRAYAWACMGGWVGGCRVGESVYAVQMGASRNLSCVAERRSVKMVKLTTVRYPRSVILCDCLRVCVCVCERVCE